MYWNPFVIQNGFLLNFYDDTQRMDYIRPYCEYLEEKMKEGRMHIQVFTFAGTDPIEVIHEMAKRHPELAFGWDDFEPDEGSDDYLGQFLIGTNHGPVPQCPDCPLPQRIVWSNYEWQKCFEHCDHPNQQCRGGCSCSCVPCVDMANYMMGSDD